MWLFSNPRLATGCVSILYDIYIFEVQFTSFTTLVMRVECVKFVYAERKQNGVTVIETQSITLDQ